MGQRRLSSQTSRLGPCLAALRTLAKSKDPHRHVFVERHIDEYLRADPFGLTHALEGETAVYFELVHARIQYCRKAPDREHVNES
jgi:hypothetical protein